MVLCKPNLWKQVVTQIYVYRWNTPKCGAHTAWCYVFILRGKYSMLRRAQVKKVRGRLKIVRSPL